MTKKYFKTSFIYALFGIFIGAFYREYTRIIGFTGQTSLRVAHTHTLVLGFILFLILTMFAKTYNLKEDKKDLEKALDELSNKAIQQIKDNKYDYGLKGKVIYIGLAHHGKDVSIKWEER